MNEREFKRRIISIAVLFIIIILYFIAKVITLHFSSKLIVPESKTYDFRRGCIRDRNGYILAMSVEVQSVFANPEEIENPEEAARLLAPLLDLDASFIQKKISVKKRFVWLKRKLDDVSSRDIENLGIKGIHLQKEYKRVYPHDAFASNIVGFVGIDNYGLEGIEYRFNDELSGNNEVSSDSPGIGELVGGKTITLTLDHFIQRVCEREIEGAVRQNSARQGVVIVLEVQTGRILALSKYPNFNANTYYNYQSFNHRNFTVIDSFEPGSTLKIIALASILENKPEILNGLFYCPGKIDISDATIKCTGVHGSIGISDVIRHSCNVGMIEAVRKLKKQELYDTYRRFGFGERTESGFPGETDGILRPYRTWSGLSKFSMAIGHEISVTSIQLASAFGAIANGGVYMHPTVIESVQNADGTYVGQFFPKMKGRVIKQSTADTLMGLMKKVVDNGTGSLAASAYYTVVGKTGTSKKFVMQEKSYTDRVISSFIGIAPYKNPEICALVIIDDPLDKQAGGQIAAPVFSRVIDDVLPYMGIKNGVSAPRNPMKKSGGSVPFDGIHMPDLRGLRLPEAMDAVIRINRKVSVTYSFSGSDEVYAQKPLPGEKIMQGEKIIIKLKEKQ